jgi:hypothetical protein
MNKPDVVITRGLEERTKGLSRLNQKTGPDIMIKIY